MTSETESFVWVYLPGRHEPVIAGILRPSTAGPGLAFRYQNGYLERPDAISIGPDLPLSTDTYSPTVGHGMPSSIRDAMPDTWGRHIINRELGAGLEDTLSDVRYMLESGSDRVGALDFQRSSRDYIPRIGGGQLTRIAGSALAVNEDRPVGSDLVAVVRNSLTAVGGSQPKAFVQFEGRSWLAKFQTEYDRISPLIKAERAAIHIASKAGIDVPEARLVTIEGHGTALLTERFDRPDGTRTQVISGFTVGGDHRPCGASYPELVERLRTLSTRPSQAGAELFRRLAFRIAMRIDDDHMRNVAFFWDGSHAKFTPAFDLSPDLPSSPVGLSDIGDGSRDFSLDALVARHRFYYLSAADARDIADSMVEAVIDHRADAAEIAEMLPHERALLLTQTATPELVGSRLPREAGQTSSAQSRDNDRRFGPKRQSLPEITL